MGEGEDQGPSPGAVAQFSSHSCYALNDHVLSNFIDMSTYWARLDNIMLTWILGTLFIKLYEVIHEP
jgi:hypothetical protein